MKNTSVWLMVAGVIMMIAGCLIFSGLNHVNMVDSNTWTINVNGMLSFPWLTYTGGVILIIGILAKIGSVGNRNMYEPY